MRVRALAVLVLVASCGPAPARPTVAATAAAPPEPTAETVAAETTDDGVAPLAAEPAPRLEVPAPADLGSAIGARLPVVELVPQNCGLSFEPVATTVDRICLVDRESGLSRAIRRFLTTYEGGISAARLGNDVVFTAIDLGMTRTRYADHVWRWSLADDRYVGLEGLGDSDAVWGGAVRVDGLDFGVLVRTEARAMLFDGTELRRLRSSEPLGDGRLVVVDGRTYLVARRRQREVVSVVTLDGPRLEVEELASYPRAWHLPLAVALPHGSPLAISAVPRDGHTELHVLRVPSDEVRELEVALERPVEARLDRSGAFLLRDDAGWHAVDLDTGAISDGEPETLAGDRAEASRAVHQIVLRSDSLILGREETSYRLSAAGVETVEEVPGIAATGCDCDGSTLRCGETSFEGGCATVPELERMIAGDGPSTPSTLYAPGGTYRVDRLEPDLTRVTRLSDGARLWVRILDDGILAQGDDGAYVGPASLDPCGYAVRWGRSLLDAPLDWLAPRREAFLRPTLIEDFFANRPLPAADTTLPSAPPGACPAS